MIRKSDLLWLSLAAFAGVTLFHTSYQVQGLREEKASLERQITAENDGIQVLKAEWSFLNDPSRLEQLAASHLTLKPSVGTQVADFDVLPMRSPTATIPVSAPPLAAAPSAAAPARKAPPVGVPQVQQRMASTASLATLASVQVPAQPLAPYQSRPHSPNKQLHPHPVVVRPTLAVAHASASGAAPHYLPAKDEIGALLTRLGRIQ